MRVTSPVLVRLPPGGLRFAESAHAMGFSMAERADPFHKLVYVLAGRAELVMAGRPVVVASAGTILIVPRLARHALRDIEPASLLLMCFSDAWLAGTPGLGELWATLVRDGDARWPLVRVRRLRIEALWRRGLFEQNRAQIGAGALAMAAANEILAVIARARALARAESAEARVRAVAAEVGDSFVENWTVDLAAARAAMSRRGFTERFRVETGETFWEHLERLRVAHAAQLLRRGEHTVLGVMFSSGFNDLSTFYRAFKRHHGTSPKRWMEAEAADRRSEVKHGSTRIRAG
ncbi:MAG: AraC family transcriptional regulator [Opitutaceae bacterium]|nr:AraC family transcriptional regulator [Opitutaceae bacterium]